jgi:hypothetical protein
MKKGMAISGNESAAVYILWGTNKSGRLVPIYIAIIDDAPRAIAIGAPSTIITMKPKNNIVLIVSHLHAYVP